MDGGVRPGGIVTGIRWQADTARRSDERRPYPGSGRAIDRAWRASGWTLGARCSPYRCGVTISERIMKLSARNQIKGRIVNVTRGATTSHVRIDIGGAVVTASITNEAVDELKLAAGQEAYAVIKASDVMVAVD